MPFPPISSQTPTSIRRLIITLFQYNDLLANGGTQAAEYMVAVEDQNGNIMHFSTDHGDLVPLLTPEELAGAQAWLDAQFQKAIDGFLG